MRKSVQSGGCQKPMTTYFRIAVSHFLIGSRTESEGNFKILERKVCACTPGISGNVHLVSVRVFQVSDIDVISVAND